MIPLHLAHTSIPFTFDPQLDLINDNGSLQPLRRCPTSHGLDVHGLDVHLFRCLIAGFGSIAPRW